MLPLLDIAICILSLRFGLTYYTQIILPSDAQRAVKSVRGLELT
jgi:hypothetical protein